MRARKRGRVDLSAAGRRDVLAAMMLHIERVRAVDAESGQTSTSIDDHRHSSCLGIDLRPLDDA